MNSQSMTGKLLIVLCVDIYTDTNNEYLHVVENTIFRYHQIQKNTCTFSNHFLVQKFSTVKEENLFVRVTITMEIHSKGFDPIIDTFLVSVISVQA